MMWVIPDEKSACMVVIPRIEIYPPESPPGQWTPTPIAVLEFPKGFFCTPDSQVVIRMRLGRIVVEVEPIPQHTEQV
jgi:hypothetical protein